MDCANLDSDFEQAMNEIKHNISFLENELDMMAISCWITRLSEPACSMEEKQRRNEYITYLSYMMKREMIHQPFTEAPPCGPLPPLNIKLITPKCGRDEDCYNDSDAGSPISGHSPYFKSEQSFRTPRQRRSSQANSPFSSRGSFRRGAPMAVSTPNMSERSPLDQSFLVRAPMRKTRTRREKDAVCSPCARPKISYSTEKPGSRLKSISKDEQKSPCPKNERPPFSPPGYLDFSSEMDDKPFMPPLPGSEEANSKMRGILESVDKCTRMFDFIRHISPLTCDQGQMLNYVATAEIAQFKEFVQSMFKTRMQDTEELLGKEQMKLKERYEEWEASVLRRAQTALRGLKRLLPEFCYELYKKDPDYLYFMLRTQYSIDETELNPQIRVLRIKAQKKRWLTDEAERMERENEDRTVELKDLNDQLNSLSRCYNSQHKEFLRKNRCLEDKVAKLRIRFHQNQKLIDALIDQLNTLPCNY